MVVPGKNRAFITTCYPKNRPLGGVMVEYDASFQAKEVWRSTKVGVHWMTPLYEDGHLYAIDGERENNSRLVCVNAETGTEVWAKQLEWQDIGLAGILGRSQPVGLGILRASLVRADGAFLCLGEAGSLHWLQLSPQGCQELQRAQLFYALQTWSAPVISHGLLYVRQQEEGLDRKSGRRLLCYDLRGKKK
jgi:outer membrane protein assembly factor BamB